MAGRGVVLVAGVGTSEGAQDKAGWQATAAKGKATIQQLAVQVFFNSFDQRWMVGREGS
jgi:hypothetical protein